MQHEKSRPNKTSTEDYSVHQRPVFCPVRCPACGKSKLVSDKQDLEAHMEREFLKCLHSSDPVCKVATRSASVQVLRDRLTKTES